MYSLVDTNWRLLATNDHYDPLVVESQKFWDNPTISEHLYSKVHPIFDDGKRVGSIIYDAPEIFKEKVR